jgi:hypothetical protein
MQGKRDRFFLERQGRLSSMHDRRDGCSRRGGHVRPDVQALAMSYLK